MIGENEKAVIIKHARRYGVKSVLIFGSSLLPGALGHDIDIGVRGTNPGSFFKLYAALVRDLPKPVDLVDLSSDTLFNRLILKKGEELLA